MKHHNIFVALAAAVLLFTASLSFAVESKADVPEQAANPAKAAPKIAHSNTRRKATANIKLVNINGATRKQLKTLPGIGDAEADKIIAGRPFGSKAWLVSKKIISMETYQALRGKIICKLTKKDIDKIMAAAHKNKKQ
jgi:DNA uptake protein ComE-like DNA-binding protein